jgi:hypothetical protein
MKKIIIFCTPMTQIFMINADKKEKICENLPNLRYLCAIKIKNNLTNDNNTL